MYDAIEDQGIEQEAIIASRFGLRVAHIVRACTDTDIQPAPPWRTRKEAYLAPLEHAGADVWLVSAADKLHNARAIVTDLRSVGPAVFDRFKAGRDGTIWFYGALAELFSRKMPSALASERKCTLDSMRDLSGS